MLQEAVASKAAKLLLILVSPVAGTTALSLGVPQVRDAVHEATLPREPAGAVTPAGATPEAAKVRVAAVKDEDMDCPTVTPFALSELPAVSGPPPVVQPSIQLAEAPPPDPAVPLTQTIFVPLTGSGNPLDQQGVPEPSTWIQLMLGFGLIGGVARLTYKRNDEAPKADPQA